MKRANLFSAEVKHDDDDPKGYETGYARLTPLLGAEKMGATIWPGAKDDHVLVRRESHVDYWDREL